MRLWFSRGGGVTLRDQLATQVALAVLCGDLKAGERLPSTRQLANRFHVHPNTASAAYRQLERDGWVASRRGSGVFVRDSPPAAPLPPPLALERMIAQLFRAARDMGLSDAEVRKSLDKWARHRSPDHFLLVEPDEELRTIAVYEIESVGALPVKCCSPATSFDEQVLAGAVPVVFPSKAAALRQALPPGTEMLVLQIRSIQSTLAAYLPAASNRLIGIASRWTRFLDNTRTMLVAAGFDPDCLLLRDARKTEWARGLEQTAAVVCDVVTAQTLPAAVLAVAFPLLAPETLAELTGYRQHGGRPNSPL